MRIAFVGDSITKGIPGIGYYSVLKTKLKDYELINYGKGGDTVVSLLERVKKIKFPENIDTIVLEVGVNDVLVNISKLSLWIKKLLKQPGSKNRKEFEKYYREILSCLSDKCKKIIAVGPILISEDMDSEWNKILTFLNGLMNEIVSEYDKVSFLNAKEIFEERLKNKTTSAYLSKNPLSVIYDAMFLRTPKSVQEKSGSRGLYYTLDGVHLNEAGAEILADAIMKMML